MKKNLTKKEKKELRENRKEEYWKKFNEEKTKEEREKEANKLVEQLKQLGLGTSAGMDPFLVKLKHYVETGEVWAGKAYLEEHKKYLHVTLTNFKREYCGIRISDNP